MISIEQAVASIKPLDRAAMDAARQRQDQLTKPLGSLGRLEELAIQIAGITGQVCPRLPRKTVVVMAADHGVVSQGVSAYPADVTPQMVMNFLKGGAAINVLSRQAGARVVVVDVGVASDIAPADGLLIRKVARGTRNLAAEPAMTVEEMRRAIQAGIDVVEAELAKGLDLVATGDMGIGNTTPSSAIVAAIAGLPVAQVVGRGTGLDNAGLSRKIETIEQGIRVNRPDPNDPLDVLAKVGGLEIAGLVGVILGGAAHRLPVVVDGFISTAAALVAAKAWPSLRPYLIPSHQSVEIGHQAMLKALDLKALFDFDMRLGEGTGAAIAMQMIDDALAIQAEMATFEEAGVSNKEQ
ncbi:MAG TPA: nicotinate-nucleotide--dimethylbenzimidazole phosphoribosyltransferase [Chloroflexota bacterium]|nr:nicotinate-nucleotide--dimethylbenzimidazole phosphoribosyltransferase [Chloroflexota bacterium]